MLKIEPLLNQECGKILLTVSLVDCEPNNKSKMSIQSNERAHRQLTGDVNLFNKEKVDAHAKSTL